MAHSDVFIFLNTVTWIFFVFFFIYLFFVLYFLPSIYKKIRFRSFFSVYLVWNSFVMSVDFISTWVNSVDTLKSSIVLVESLLQLVLLRKSNFLINNFFLELRKFIYSFNFNKVDISSYPFKKVVFFDDNNVIFTSLK